MSAARKTGKPNVVFVFGDQWRAQATGYSGSRQVKTPNLDRLASECVNFTNAVSGYPVCSPYRASLITGRCPLTHGVFLNDVHLDGAAVSIADAFRGSGYRTAYIGKWHLDGRGRKSFIPREARQGFDFWKVLECTHDYNRSAYYGDRNEKLAWDGYDAFAQTREAIRYICEYDSDKPFLLLLSWGPPHNPYDTAPEEYRAMYDPGKLALRPNVPEEHAEDARKTLAGYYAHCTALDACVGWLLEALAECGLEDETVFVFTSDHGDMVGSRGAWDKQRPYDESIRVPFLLRYPAVLGRRARRLAAPIDAQDVMPTLLGLCGVEIPGTVEGLDYSGHIKGGPNPGGDAALLSCIAPFGNWHRGVGGREYRGIRTLRHTYVRDLDGPWLLFDNEADPYQLDNLAGKPQHAELQAQLDALLDRKLRERGDEFLPARAYLDRWQYVTNERGIAVRQGRLGQT